MPRFKPTGTLERTAPEDLWKHTLSKIPTVYGRLMYLASLRDSNSGVYRHHGLSAVFGKEESGQALKKSHQKTFQEWLTMPLADKHEDLMVYIDALEDPGLLAVDHWLRSKLYESLVPVPARKMERQLFNHELEVLLETIRNGLRDAAPNPAASPLV